jgi:hypothetical protein
MATAKVNSVLALEGASIAHFLAPLLLAKTQSALEINS